MVLSSARCTQPSVVLIATGWQGHYSLPPPTGDHAQLHCCFSTNDFLVKANSVREHIHHWTALRTANMWDNGASRLVSFAKTFCRLTILPYSKWTLKLCNETHPKGFSRDCFAPYCCIQNWKNRGFGKFQNWGSYKDQGSELALANVIHKLFRTLTFEVLSWWGS